MIDEHGFLSACNQEGLHLDVMTNRYRRVEHPWGLRDRQWDYHVMYYVMQHQVVVKTDTEEALMRPHSFMWMGPQVQHSLFPPDGGLGDKKVRLIHIVFRTLLNEKEIGSPYPLIIAHQAGDMQAPMRMFHEQLQIESLHGTSVHRYLLGTIAAMAFNHFADAAGKQERGLEYTQRERLQELFSIRGAHELHPRDLAREVGLSHYYFTRLFTHSYGMSPRAWLHQQRLDQAVNLLETTQDSISEIAHACGYPEVFPFSKQFKKRFGQSPSHFRKNSQGWNEAHFDQ